MGAFGCGASNNSAADLPTNMSAGDIDDPPSMEVLPSPDIPQSEWTEKMRFAWLLTEQSFELPPPKAPVDPTAPELEAWTDGPLKKWVEQKTKMVAAAREELNKASEESSRQRIFAGALVGLMYEDIGRVMIKVPVPEDIKNDPEIAEVYQDVIESHAFRYLKNSHRAYSACAQNARRPTRLKHWSRWCRSREGNLPITKAEVIGPTSPSGTTTVEVVRE